MNVTPPIEIAAWLGCLAFAVMLLNGGIRLVASLKDKPAPGEVRAEALSRFVDRENFNAALSEHKQARDQIFEIMKTNREDLEHTARVRSAGIYEKIEKVRLELSVKHDELRTEMTRNFQDLERSLGRIEGKLK